MGVLDDSSNRSVVSILFTRGGFYDPLMTFLGCSGPTHCVVGYVDCVYHVDLHRGSSWFTRNKYLTASGSPYAEAVLPIRTNVDEFYNHMSEMPLGRMPQPLMTLLKFLGVGGYAFNCVQSATDVLALAGYPTDKINYPHELLLQLETKYGRSIWWRGYPKTSPTSSPSQGGRSGRAGPQVAEPGGGT